MKSISLEVGQQITVHSARIFSNLIEGYPLICTVTYKPSQNRDSYCFDVPYNGGVVSQSSYLSDLIFDVMGSQDIEGI